MADKKKENKNIIFVTLFISVMLIFMLGTVVYVTNQVANCSSAKKARKVCYSIEKKTEIQRIIV
ncbi:hypothetical protein ACM66Z_02690 [Sulfurovum sp. ST-21]|uniref:Uncharacterized protein n=1 Tax=Sulfurovum indicum TaxID=2779528 RepID=A0A7M1S4X5_9BACT|nr:hypothetical protein [Sulfurovum indicum]QOR62398.1 hypothetical protein IMZ28_02680 [Sulfurovum indicum]